MRGGYVPRRSYMIRGDPGAGKTTVGLHFLVAGAAGGEMTLYITVGESEEQIHKDILRMPYLQSEKSDIR